MAKAGWSRPVCLLCKDRGDEDRRTKKRRGSGIGNWIVLAVALGATAVWYFKIELPFAKGLLAKASAMVGLGTEGTAAAGAGPAAAGGEESVGSSVADTGLTTTTTADGLLLNFRSDVLFEFGKAALKSTASDALRSAAATIRQRPTASVVIRGYTDSVGTEKANLDLSLQRAEAVRSWIVKMGVPARQLSVQGMGAKDPVAANTKADGSDNPAGREQNRRVTITIKGA